MCPVCEVSKVCIICEDFSNMGEYTSHASTMCGENLGRNRHLPRGYPFDYHFSHMISS